jgi:hypothetical protein
VSWTLIISAVFTMDFNKLNHFVKNCVVYMEPNKQEAKNICKIQAEVRKFFIELADSEKFKPSFTPHMKISDVLDASTD